MGNCETLDAKTDALEKKIAKASAKNPISALLDEVPRDRTADLVGDRGEHSRSQRIQIGERFQRIFGPDASQHSSGGKEKLGAITKKGNRYLRKMLVVGCTSVLRVAHKYKGSLAESIVAMRAKKPERVVAVALANKLARICWAIMSTGESFRAETYSRA